MKQLGADVRDHSCTSPGEHWPSGIKREDACVGHFRVLLHHKKGGDMGEWSENLRRREWP